MKVAILIFCMLFGAGCSEYYPLEREILSSEEKQEEKKEPEKDNRGEALKEDSKEEKKDEPKEISKTEEKKEGVAKDKPQDTQNKTEPLIWTKDRNLSSYENYPNNGSGWWFRRPKPRDKGVLATIDPAVQKLIEKYNAIWQGDVSKKKVYITMDEGYEYKENSTKILDIAKEKNVKITFFITGAFIKERPDLVKRMIEEGHLVCSHTNRHLNGPKALSESTDKFVKDLTILEDLFRDLMGYDILPYYRPPEGEYSERSLKIAEDLGYRTVFWSFAYMDWDTKKQPDPAKALDQILGELHNGSVLLLHAVSETNVSLLPKIIDGIRERGYEISTIDDI